MLRLNPSSIEALDGFTAEQKTLIRQAYRVLRLAYFGRIFLPTDRVEPVKSAQELEEAQSLVYSAYRKKDLCKENGSAMYYTPYTLLSSATTLCARRSGRLTGTCTVIQDGPLGLPSDALYKRELDYIRRTGRQLVEVGSLATDKRVPGGQLRSLGSIRKFNLVMNLFSGVLRYVYRHTKATYIVIMVAEKHKMLYEVIGFKQFADVRYYDLVKTAAVPMIGDIEYFLASAADHLPALYMVKTFGHLMPKQQYQISAHDLAIRAEKNPAFFANLSDQAAAVLIKEHPKFKFILELLRENQQIFEQDFTTQTHELWLRFQEALRNFLAPPDAQLLYSPERNDPLA